MFNIFELHLKKEKYAKSLSQFIEKIRENQASKDFTDLNLLNHNEIVNRIHFTIDSKGFNQSTMLKGVTLKSTVSTNFKILEYIIKKDKTIIRLEIDFSSIRWKNNLFYFKIHGSNLQGNLNFSGTNEDDYVRIL